MLPTSQNKVAQSALKITVALFELINLELASR